MLCVGSSLLDLFKSALIFLHKWFGVALALFFLTWFVSGIVLHFMPFPSLTQAERLANLPLLIAPSDCCLSAHEVANRDGLYFTQARFGLDLQRPVWRLLARPLQEPQTQTRWYALDARHEASAVDGTSEVSKASTSVQVRAPDGDASSALIEARAAAVATAFSGQQALATELIDRDQWTVPQGMDPYRPLVRVELDGDEGLQLYVSVHSHEVVRDTRRVERFWNWLGAVPHWIYFTELRRWPQAWHHTVVWIAIPAVVLASSGLILGIWQLFLNRTRWIPYKVFWPRWHHILGLTAALFTLTWIFSGLMSMNPFKVFSARSATAAELSAWHSGQSPESAPALRARPSPALQRLSAALPDVRELQGVLFGGHWWLRGISPSGVRWLDPESGQVLGQLPDELVRARLQQLRKPTEPNAVIESIELISAYDDLYYARDGTQESLDARPLAGIDALADAAKHASNEGGAGYAWRGSASGAG